MTPSKSASKRRMVRSLEDGNLGEIIERDGKQFVLLDRPKQEIIKPYNPNLWQAEHEERPLSKLQAARIAYEADKAMRMASGEFGGSAKDWLSMKDEERIRWMRNGPAATGRRREVWIAITDIFSDAE